MYVCRKKEFGMWMKRGELISWGTAEDVSLLFVWVCKGSKSGSRKSQVVAITHKY